MTEKRVVTFGPPQVKIIHKINNKEKKSMHGQPTNAGELAAAEELYADHKFAATLAGTGELVTKGETPVWSDIGPGLAALAQGHVNGETWGGRKTQKKRNMKTKKTRKTKKTKKNRRTIRKRK